MFPRSLKIVKNIVYDAAYYRPVSLACICCKTLEHIIVININTHFALDSILWFSKSDALRNFVDPVCTLHHHL